MSYTEAIAVVVIGRNEGQRLQHSLESVRAANLPVIYVDSGSTDGSAETARTLGVQVVRLDPSRPFSAARGRNEGLRKARKNWPETRYVMFLDGDCVLEKSFPRHAAEEMERKPECAVVVGHLLERSPTASIYNRMCAIEWQGPTGLIEDMNGLGGIMVVRVSAFDEVAGFTEEAISGEEADLGVRLRLAGYSLIKIDHPMATHDADMHTFKQWWRRAVRNGNSLAHRYVSHGRTEFRDGLKGLRSTLAWGCVFPGVALLLAWPSRGLSLVGLAVGYALLSWRIYRHYVGAGQSRSDSLLMARFLVCAKFAECLGVLRYGFSRYSGRYAIIEWR